MKVECNEQQLNVSVVKSRSRFCSITCLDESLL